MTQEKKTCPTCLGEKVIEGECQDLCRLLLAKITLNPLYVSCIWYCEPVSKVVDHSWLEATPTSHCQLWDPAEREICEKA